MLTGLDLQNIIYAGGIQLHLQKRFQNVNEVIKSKMIS